MSGMKLVDGELIPLTPEELAAQEAARNDPANIARQEARQLQDLINYSANKRWEIETSGIMTTSGVPIRTDADSQRKIGQLRVRTVTYGELQTPFQFKATDGWHSLGQAEISKIDVEMADHVSRCYEAESQIELKIVSKEITTTQQIDDFYTAYCVPPKYLDQNMIVPNTTQLDGIHGQYSSNGVGLIVRIAGRNLTGGDPGISVAWGSTLMTIAKCVFSPEANTPFALLAVIKASKGTHDLKINCSVTTGSCAIRVDEATALDDTWQGAIGFQTGTGSSGNAELLPAPTNSRVLQIADWADDRATPINKFHPATDQWQANYFKVSTELVVNGGFDTDTNWVKGNGWSIADGKATRGVYGGGLTILKQQPVAMTIGDRWLSSYDVVETAGGTFRFVWATVGGNKADGISHTGVGHYEQALVVPTGTGSSLVNGFGLRGDANIVAPGTVFDNYSLKKIEVGGLSVLFAESDSTDGSFFSFETSNAFSGTYAILAVELKGLILAA